MEIKTVQDLLDILNNTHEIPNPELSDLCFYYTDKNGKVIDLHLDRIGAFDISTDITFHFSEDKESALMKQFIDKRVLR